MPALKESALGTDERKARVRGRDRRGAGGRGEGGGGEECTSIGVLRSLQQSCRAHAIKVSAVSLVEVSEGIQIDAFCFALHAGRHVVKGAFFSRAPLAQILNAELGLFLADDFEDCGKRPGEEVSLI